MLGWPTPCSTSFFLFWSSYIYIYIHNEARTCSLVDGLGEAGPKAWSVQRSSLPESIECATT